MQWIKVITSDGTPLLNLEHYTKIAADPGNPDQTIFTDRNGKDTTVLVTIDAATAAMTPVLGTGDALGNVSR